MKKLLLAALVAALGSLLTPRVASAYGAAHVGYTHVGPNVETLEQFAGSVLQRRWDELRPYYQPVTEGHHLSIDPIPFTRDLNARTDDDQTRAAGAGGDIPLRKAISLNYVEKPVPEVNNGNWEGRLADMDREGVDVHLIFPATFSTAASVFDVELQTELYAAYHRYLVEYCGDAPDRSPLRAGAGAFAATSERGERAVSRIPHHVRSAAPPPARHARRPGHDHLVLRIQRLDQGGGHRRASRRHDRGWAPPHRRPAPARTCRTSTR